MKRIFFLVAYSILGIVLCLSCNKESDINNEPIELRDNFSETEFKNALIGEWQSVFEIEGNENVIYL